MNAGAAEIGPLRVTEMTSPAGQCVRTARQAGPADAGWHQVEVLVRGRLSVEQAGASASYVPAPSSWSIRPGQPDTPAPPPST